MGLNSAEGLLVFLLFFVYCVGSSLCDEQVTCLEDSLHVCVCLCLSVQSGNLNIEVT